MNKIRVLQIGAGNLINRGVEKFIMNLSIGLDNNKIQMDVLTPGICQNEILKKQIQYSGGEVIELNCTLLIGIRYLELILKFRRILKEKEYQIVQVQTGSIPLLAIGTKIAKQAGVPIVIAHSANTHTCNFKYKLQKKLFFPMLQYADHYWGCSLNACKDSFPLNILDRACVIPYGIEVDRFKFNAEERKQIRKQLGITGKLVLGHIGAFTEQKNHIFLLDIFRSVHSLQKDSVLLLVGEGELMNDIKRRAKNMGLSDAVIFYGTTENVPLILSAMDVFCFPSRWEGLGIVLIEAQASGLPCVVSSEIQPETVLTERYWMLELSEPPQKWAKYILDIDVNIEREKANDIVAESEFDLKKVVSYINSIYTGLEDDKWKLADGGGGQKYIVYLTGDRQLRCAS